MANRAAFITALKAHPMEVRDAPMPTPESYQVVIKVMAVAVNPVDIGIQNMGIIVEQYPSVLGNDMAGDIHAIGADVKHLKVGDRVLASGDLNPGETFLAGTFQYYTTTHHKLVAKIPDSLSYADACVLPLGMATAGTGLFDKRCMGLGLPHVGAESKDSTLLIWGGASSVGSCGIQLARAAGYDVITTSSSKNFAYCRALGVKEVFNYKEPDVVDQILAYLKGKRSAGVFNAIMTPETIIACNHVAHRSGGYKHVGTVVPEGHPLPEGLPEDVTTSYNWGIWLKDNEVGHAIFVDWIPQALSNGTLKCKPDANVIGKGLDKVQEAVDYFAANSPSASKIVVEIQ